VLLPSSYNRVGVVFDASGKPSLMFADESLNNGSSPVFTGVLNYELDSKFHVLIGRTDQVNAILSKPSPADRDSPLSNVLDSSNNWVTLNPLTGLVSSAAVAEVPEVVVESWVNETDADAKAAIYRRAVSQARAFATSGVRDASNN
ncbi:MAG: hypothetical protein AAF483_10665, partial [Planctomycetota bacterium]